MNQFTYVMEHILRRVGLQGIVPTGSLPSDNTEEFDPARQPEQYSEFIDF